MKTAIRVIALVMVAACVLTLFTACGSTLKGTYAPAEGSGTITFEKDNKVKGEIFGLTLSGTYSIEKDEIKFETEGLLGIGATKTFSFSKEGKSIFIDGKEFVKQ
ncbi:MAG: hypothetical protein IJM02_04390 [Clostridia bacterium]|nr:hypothetical protein [Clostridia bacterium]